MSPSFPTARNAVLSLLQSAAAALARRGNSSVVDPTGHPMTQAVARIVAARQDPQRTYAPTTPVMPSMTCAGLGLELLEAIVDGNQDKQRELHDRLSFSRCDPLWAKTLVEYAQDLQLDGQPRAIPYIRYAALTDFVLPAPQASMRIALISDWGTGTAEARGVIALLAQQQPDAVIHLGDVYYSGTAEECTANFLRPMRAALPDQPLFTLCGNHDVYSGGQGYYGLLRQIGQPASYFCLRSPDHAWQILGADTGLNDRDPFDETTALTKLDPTEERWHADKIRGFPGRTIFLSHHQPFSAFAQIGLPGSHDPVNPNLMASHDRLTAAGGIDAWFWGHEHRLRIYAPYRGVATGRNIGYGAIPVEAVPGPPTPLPGLVDPPALRAYVRLDVVEGAYTHGFALLDLGPGTAEASYWALTQPDGPVYQETLWAAKVA